MFIKSNQRAALTQIELLLGITVGLLVILAATALWMHTSTTFAWFLNYVDLSSSSRNAVNRICQQIRQAKSLKSYQSNEVTLVDFDEAELKFSYNSSQKTLTQTKNGHSTIMLRGCDYLTFSIYQRTPIGGSFDLNSADTNTAKLVQVQWRCSRPIPSAHTNYESLQSAKVVIRKG